MPNTREKLIELLEQCDVKCHKTPCNECEYYCNRDCNRQMELDHLIANGVTVQKWISVKDKLPKKGEDVLVVVCASYDTWVTIDCLMRDGRWCVDADKKRITHWMPLPEPPKGE